MLPAVVAHRFVGSRPRKLGFWSLSTAVVVGAVVAGPVLTPTGVPVLGSAVASAEQEPGGVPSQPVGGVPAPADPAAAIDSLPRELGAIPGDQSQTVEVGSDWTQVPGLPVEVRPQDKQKLTESPADVTPPPVGPTEPGFSPSPSGDATTPSDAVSQAALRPGVGARGTAPSESPSASATSVPSASGSASSSPSPSQGSPTATPSTTASPAPAGPAKIAVDVAQPDRARQRTLLLNFSGVTTPGATGTGAPGSALSSPSGASAGRSLAGGSLVAAPAVAAPEDGELSAGSDDDDTSDDLEVRLSYAAFAEAYGGVWGERMQVVAYPACFATTPELEQCATGVPVQFTNDLGDQTLTFATVEDTVFADTDGAQADLDDDTQQPGEVEGYLVPSEPSDPDGSTLDGSSASPSMMQRSAFATTAAAPETSSGGAVYSVSGDAGNYAATPLSPSMGWQVGPGAGDFTYGYDFELPAALGGSTPGLSLNYSSGGVDAMSLAENGQADPAGIGWSMSRSYVARQFGSCSDDGWPNKGDLCWKTRGGELVDDFTIALNGRSSKLVRVDKDGMRNQFRLRQDPNWQVELLTGNTGNGDDDGEYFKVTDTQGVKYWFGPDAQSAQTVPVYGDDSGEPCYGKSSTAGQRWCDQGYQWNLQRMVDQHGNKIVYSYEEEQNHYARWADTSNNTVYDRSALLGKIEYGFSFDQQTAHQVVNLVTGKRCTKELEGGTCESNEGPVNKPNLWPDVPSDLICNSSQTCLVGSPAFFSTRRYSRIVTRTVDGNGGSPTTRTVDTYDLNHTMPDPDGSGPDQADLWLSKVTRTGSGGSTGSLTLPSVRFFGTELRNRVVAPSGERTLKKFRIGGIRNETGGKIDVEYGHASSGRVCDAAYVNNRDRWDSARECFAQKYTPTGGAEQWEWFHKYVVTRVALGDVALGYQLGTGSNTALGTLRVYDYEYRGAPAWRFLDSRHMPTSKESWTDWRGYAETLTHTRKANSTNSGVLGSDVSIARTVQFRGMNQSVPAPGQPITTGTRIDTAEITNEANEQLDEAWFAGKVAESEVKTPGGQLIERTFHEYGDAVTAKDPNGINARVVYDQLTRVRTPIDGSNKDSVRETTTQIDKGSNAPNSNFGAGVGTVVRVESHAERKNGTVEYQTCATTAWVTNNDTRVRAPRETITTAKACDGDAKAEWLRRTHNWYDGSTGTSRAITMGDLTSTRTYINADGSSYEGTKYSYDQLGRVTSQTTGITEVAGTGNTTTTDYNPNNGPVDNLLTKVKTTGPTGHVSETYLDPRRGLPQSIVDANSNTTVLDYDPVGRLSQAQLPNLVGTNKQSMTFEYIDSDNSPNRVKTSVRFDDGSEGYQDSYTFYDGWGRSIETQVPHPDPTPDPNKDPKRIVSFTGYDELGLVEFSAPSEWNDSAPLFATVVNPDLNDLYRWSQNQYDAAGRVTKTQDMTRENGVATGVRHTSTTYAGDKVIVSPPDGAGTTRTLLDAGGNPTEIQLRDATESSWLDRTQYGYNDLGELLNVTKTLDATTMEWTWSYDGLGRTTQANDPDTGKTTTIYGSAPGTTDKNSLTTTTVETPDGTIKETVDGLGRPIERRDITPGGTEEVLATWTYDTATGAGTGHLHKVTSTTPATSDQAEATFTTEYGDYDTLGNPGTLTQTYPGILTGEGAGAVSRTTNYTYDYAGDLAEASYPAITAGAAAMPATVVKYDKFNTGAWESIEATIGGATAVLADYGYTNIGQLKTLTSAQSTAAGAPLLERSYSYETALGRTDRISVATDPDGGVEGGTPAMNRLALGYTYDRNDNPTAITRTTTTSNGGASTTTSAQSCFSYDDLNRLLSATDRSTPGATAPACTDSGTAIATNYDYTYTYDTQGDRLTSITSNAGGNQGVATYNYNDTAGALHQLTSIEHTDAPGAVDAALLPAAGTQTWGAAADTYGQVTASSITSGGNTTYAYNTQGQLEKTAQDGGPTVENLYGPDGLRLARRTTAPDGTESTVLYLNDGLEVHADTADGTNSITKARRDHLSPDGVPLASQDDASLTWLATDSQGSTRLTATSDSTPDVTAHNYTPYGDPLPTGGPVGTPGNRGYLSKPHDPTGDIRLDHRSFTPSTGTFTSPDPVLVRDDPTSFNPYAYAQFNSLAMSDPDGLRPVATSPGEPDPEKQPYFSESSNEQPHSPVSGGGSNAQEGSPSELRQARDQLKEIYQSYQQVAVGTFQSVWLDLTVLTLENEALSQALRGDITRARAIAIEKILSRSSKFAVLRRVLGPLSSALTVVDEVKRDSSVGVAEEVANGLVIAGAGTAGAVLVGVGYGACTVTTLGACGLAVAVAGGTAYLAKKAVRGSPGWTNGVSGWVRSSAGRIASRVTLPPIVFR